MVSEKIDQFALTGALKEYFQLARRVERVWISGLSPEAKTTSRFSLRLCGDIAPLTVYGIKIWAGYRLACRFRWP